MNTTVSILFYIKRAKVNSNGVCPIYVRVTIDARRFEFSANKSVSTDISTIFKCLSIRCVYNRKYIITNNKLNVCYFKHKSCFCSE